MKNIVFLFLMLPMLAWGQYPDNARKQRLGYQTTGAGLVYIKSGAPAHTPANDEDTWMVLDTTNNILYYWDEPAGAWENLLDDVVRDTVFQITNVPDTSVLVPLQGDIFFNAARDTMGVYTSQWVLFYGGDDLGNHTATQNLNMDGNTILGGTGTTSDLILQTTSGVGATGADMFFLVGNNGGTEAMKILNNGNIGMGGASTPAQTLHVQGTARITGSDGTPTGLMGRDADGDVGAVSLGTGLTLTTGTLTANDTVTTLIQDSILVYSLDGVEVSRDTVRTPGGGGGGGTLTGSGTANRVALWSAATALTDSYLLQSATALTLDANKALQVTGGTTASRPAAAAGLHWYNTTDSRPQWSNGTSWFEYSPWTRNGNNIYFNTASAGVSIGTTAKEGVFNVAGNVGTDAGTSNVAFFENFNAITAGSNNVGLGYRNFYLGTSLDECVGSGYFNFYSINSARGNIGQGASNFYLATGGDNNVGQGRENFSLGTGTFTSNVGQGYRNFYNHTGGSGNIGQGTQNFQALTTGNYNVGKGGQNFLSLTSGEYNTGMGFRNFQLATSGNYNFATGQNNCRFVTSATATFAGGYLAGPYLSGDNTANYSFFWGYEAMNNATQADHAIAIGYQAGKSNTYLEPILLGKSVTAAVDYHAVIGGTSYTRLTSGLYSWNVNQSLTGKGDYRMKYNSSSGEMEVAPSALSTRGRLTETTTNTLTPISTGFIRVAGLSSADLSNFTATDSTLTYTGTESVLMEIRYSGAISMAASGGGTYLARFKVYVNSTAYDESQAEVQVIPAAADTWKQTISGSTWVTLATNDVVSLKFDGTTSGYTLALEKLNLTVNAL